MGSASGLLIWGMKWSKELRSIPRMVIPAWWMTSSSPQIFSLGVCRLTTTMECGSMDDESQLTSGIQVVEAQPRLAVPQESFGTVVGLVYPPQCVAEVGLGIQLENKPFCTRRPGFGVNTRVLLCALPQLGRHRLDSEDQRLRVLYCAGDWTGGKGCLAAIAAAKTEQGP